MAGQSDQSRAVSEKRAQEPANPEGQAGLAILCAPAQLFSERRAERQDL